MTATPAKTPQEHERDCRDAGPQLYSMLKMLVSANESYFAFLNRSLNVGPLTSNPTREVMLLSLMRDRTAAARAALAKADAT